MPSRGVGTGDPALCRLLELRHARSCRRADAWWGITILPGAGLTRIGQATALWMNRSQEALRRCGGAMAIRPTANPRALLARQGLNARICLRVLRRARTTPPACHSHCTGLLVQRGQPSSAPR